MNRDLSVSKAGQSSAYENRNIRIEARDGDTLLSVTNERGNKQIPLSSYGIRGELVGWNVLNNHIILFTYEVVESQTVNRIYRVDYVNNQFVVVCGTYPSTDSYDYFLDQPLFIGDLGIDDEHPIESVVYFESEDIQKIYWVDGKNVLRFMNFTGKIRHETRTVQGMEIDYYLLPWERLVERYGLYERECDTTYFDSNRAMNFGVSVDISKDDSGSTRANGITQYILTYYNKHGQETGYAYMSDIVYLSPNNRGGAADETNTNRVVLKISNLDTSFDHFKVYSIFRSSLDGEVVANLVADRTTSAGTVTVMDDGAHLTSVDAQAILYLGSQPVIAGTMTHKDQTLFLGDLKSIGRRDYDELEAVIRQYCFVNGAKFEDGVTWESDCVAFDYSTSDTLSTKPKDIPYAVKTDQYSYSSQLKLTSSDILSFKGGEKYRFALKFQLKDGTETDAFWIGDAENDKYPVIDETNNVIKRVIAVCEIPSQVITFLNNSTTGYKSVQLLVAQATYADRSVKAQGILCPTVFNTWERYQNRVYSMPSWIFRPRGAAFANLHFEPIHNSTRSSGEIQCNYWKEGERHPYYQYDLNAGGGIEGYHDTFDGKAVSYQHIMLVYGFVSEIMAQGVYIITATLICSKDSTKIAAAEAAISAYEFDNIFTPTNKKGIPDANILEIPFTNDDGWIKYNNNLEGWYFKILVDSNDPTVELVRLDGRFYSIQEIVASGTSFNLSGDAEIWEFWRKQLEENLDIPREFIITYDKYVRYMNMARANHFSGRWYVNDNITSSEGSSAPTSLDDVLNYNDSDVMAARWKDTSEYAIADIYGNRTPAYYKKHLSFIDENVVTLSSPELSYEQVSFSGGDVKLRIVGAAPIHSLITDYTIDATVASTHGANPDEVAFNGSVNSSDKGVDGLTSWPLWRETSLGKKDDAEYQNVDIEDLSYDAYNPGGGLIHYWMYLWQRHGNIPAYKRVGTGITDDYLEYSNLNRKVFANLRFANTSIYFNSPEEYDLEDSRTVPIYSGNMFAVETVEDIYKNYAGSDVDYILTLPGEHKYPLVFSDSLPSTTASETASGQMYLFSSEPIDVLYREDTHAVLCLPTTETSSQITQTILPYLFDSEKSPHDDTIADTDISDAILPWSYGPEGEPQEIIALLYDRLYPSYPPREDYVIPITSITIDAETQAVYAECSEGTGNWRNKLYDAIGMMRDIETTRDNCIVVETIDDTDTVYLVKVTATDIDSNILYIYGFLKGEAGATGVKTVRANIYKDDLDDLLQLRLLNYGLNEVDIYDLQEFWPVDDYKVYRVSQEHLTPTKNNTAATDLASTDKYFLLGEAYIDYGEGSLDTRYGGISLNAVKNNRFIAAGPSYPIGASGAQTIYGNQGDTYIQRWDSLKTLPYSNDSVNNVIDIASVMLETHVNLDGRTDNQRGILQLASVDTTKFNSLNPVYSQTNDFSVRRDLDEDFNMDSYRSSLTWTLSKADMADVDEWTHITLGSSLKLDGDKGICRALRRFKNSIIAFQDKGVSEVLFNSRTQITSQDGVPIEIGNSGRVDGKRYLTNKHGCINKWSIAEGKESLYFVDDINKEFCNAGFNRNGSLAVESISTRLGFATWFKKKNSLATWTPKDFKNFVAFYDRANTDVYLVSKKGQNDTEAPTLVFNETLGVFTSFFDYDAVPMMTNVENRFISFKQNDAHKPLYLQNEGFYGNFFGTHYPFYVQYRVTPEPFGDKIWTNVEYRADFYKVLNNSAADLFKTEDEFLNNQEAYQKDETFTYTKFWNEYQETMDEASYNLVPKKDFRIWRLAIPRAKKTSTNKYGLDRIRNPWLNLLFKKTYGSNEETKDLMQLHDIIVKYFE